MLLQDVTYDRGSVIPPPFVVTWSGPSGRILVERWHVSVSQQQATGKHNVPSREFEQQQMLSALTSFLHFSPFSRWMRNVPEHVFLSRAWGSFTDCGGLELLDVDIPAEMRKQTFPGFHVQHVFVQLHVEFAHTIDVLDHIVAAVLSQTERTLSMSLEEDLTMIEKTELERNEHLSSTGLALGSFRFEDDTNGQSSSSAQPVPGSPDPRNKLDSFSFDFNASRSIQSLISPPSKTIPLRHAFRTSPTAFRSTLEANLHSFTERA